MSEPSTTSLTFGMRVYRGIFRTVLGLAGRWLFGEQRWTETHRALVRLEEVAARSAAGKNRIWFHAASVGELESLWPLVELASADPQNELVITVFSSSVWNHLHRISRKLENPPVFYGYSPIEGSWTEVLSGVRPDLFVTAKYEAWPEIWNTLALLDVPLAIVGAKPRSSLLWAKRLLGFFRGLIPRLIFFSFDHENEAGLRAAFPSATIHHGSDPRWDRVFARAQIAHARVQELEKEFADLPRPWGIVGSAWPTDLARFPLRSSEQVPGTVWFVPHRTDAKSVSEVEILIRDRGWTPVRTGSSERIRPAGKLALLVDEMGFLTELYSLMDWAFVGGGFGTSIHSTIEPSVYGLPVIGGPKGQKKFDEIALLVRQGQMQILSDPKNEREALVEWVRRIASGVGPLGARDRWRAENQSHRAASARTWELLKKTLDSPK